MAESLSFGARAHLRAIVIALALLVNGIAASPLPKSVKRSQFTSEVGVEELDRWVDILGGVGVSVSRKELGEHLYTVGRFFTDLRRSLLDPFGAWFRTTGTGQGWGLFTYPDSYPYQLVIEVRKAGGEWRPVYAALDPDATWRRSTFVYRRVRGVYDGNTRKPGASYENFVAWVGERALAEFPDEAEVRVGFIRTHSTMPHAKPDPERLPAFRRVVIR